MEPLYLQIPAEQEIFPKTRKQGGMSCWGTTWIQVWPKHKGSQPLPCNTLGPHAGNSISAPWRESYSTFSSPIGSNFPADLTVHGFAAIATIKGKLCPHYSHFSWPLPLVADCFLTVLQILGGALCKRDTTAFLSLSMVIQHGNEPT